MPKVSLIIPVHNGEDFIRDALDSVLNQTFRGFEIIVIDDGSNDHTPNILREYEDKIKWQSQENKGQASALNAGIKRAVGEYIAYLDADDVILPERLEIQVKHLDEHPETGFVYSDQYRTDKLGTVRVRSRHLDKFLLLQKCYIPRDTVMHRRSCLNEVGLFDESITGSDDWDMWIRMSEKCKMDYIDKPLAEYRIHGSNISFTRPKRLEHYRWTRMRILEKAYERRGRPFWLKLMLINATIQWIVGKVPILGERFPHFWSGVDKLQILLEGLLVKRILRRGRVIGARK